MSNPYNLVAQLADGGAVRYEDHRLFGGGGKEPRVQFALGFFVERRADFVEQEDAARAE